MLKVDQKIFHQTDELFENVRVRTGNIREWAGKALSNLHKRGVIHGFPVALITSIALGFLFESGNLFACLAYGLINYGVTTALIEWLEAPRDHERPKYEQIFIAVLTFAAGLLAGKAFVNTILQTNMTFMQSFPLACGAYVGQVARVGYIMSKESCIE